MKLLSKLVFEYVKVASKCFDVFGKCMILARNSVDVFRLMHTYLGIDAPLYLVIGTCLTAIFVLDHQLLDLTDFNKLRN